MTYVTPVSQAQGEVTRLLDAVAGGEEGAADRLLPLVYDELRRLARARLSRERHPEAPQPTSLVHEAYLRLIGSDALRHGNRSYFFAAAGEAMRRILVDRARERLAQKRGGDRERVTLDEQVDGASHEATQVLAVHEALALLERKDAAMADVVRLRYFAGLTIPETAEALGTSPRTINRLWTAAHVWLRREIRRGTNAASDRA